MRKILIGIVYLVCTLSASAQVPDWIIRRPVSSTEYIGIGFASLSDSDYMKKATQNALSDIASQIAMKLENNSLLQRIDLDGKSHEILEDEIRNSAEAWLEGQKLVDAYQSADKYYVYYALDKVEYTKNAEMRRRRALNAGLDCLQKGRQEEDAMNLSQAAMLYIKGLETVEPWAFMDLSTIIDGQFINVPVELYESCVNLLGGMALVSNVVNVEGETFKAISEPLAVCLSKDGVVVPNVKLKATFVKGEGEVTPAVETDYTGTAEFYVTNITSKDEVQEIRIELDESFFEKFPKAYCDLLSQALPSAKITVALKSLPLTAYFSVSDDNDLEGVENRVKALLTNNHFTITANPDEADCFMELSSKLDVGEVVTGGVNDLNCYYCSLTLKFYDNRTEQLLLDYSVNNVKVLYPTSKNVSQSLAQCVREVMKRVSRELPNQIKKLKIN